MPNAPNYEAAEIDYMNGMKYKALAEKYCVSINTIKSWKQRYGWSKDKKSMHTKNEKSVHTKRQKVCTQIEEIKEAVDIEVDLLEENSELTEKQQLFCIYFVRCLNATIAYQKAYGCSYNTAMVEGSRTLRNPKIRDEITKLKKERLTREFLTEEDIFQKYMDIAFGDIGNYLKFGKKVAIEYKKNKSGKNIPVIDPVTGEPKTYEYNYMYLNDSDDIDTSLLSEVSEGKNGIKVKMHDQLKALDWLASHMEMATEEQKARLELLKAQKDKIKNINGTGDDESVVIVNDV